MNHIRRLGAILMILSIWQVVPNLNAYAQDCNLEDVLSIDIQLAPILEQSQVLGLTALGVDNRGSGPQLFQEPLKMKQTSNLIICISNFE